MKIFKNIIAITILITLTTCSTTETYNGKEFKDKNKLLKYKQLEIEYGSSLEKDSIIKAIKYNNIEKVKALIDANIDINQLETDGEGVWADGNNGLMVLISSDADDKRNIAKLLIENGIDLTHKNKKGQNALIYSIERGCNSHFDSRDAEDIFNILIESNINIEEKDINGNTALISSANPQCWLEKHTRYFVHNLVLKGANLDSKNIEGDTALINALKRREGILNAGRNHAMVAHFPYMLSDNKKTINILIEAGINTEIKNNEGESAYTLAKKIGDKEILQKLSKKNQ